MIKTWDKLPDFLKTDEVKPYYEVLKKHTFSLVLKRLFDLILAIIVLGILLIPMMAISILIKLDSPGPIFYRQLRVTRYGKYFNIHKFRTMYIDADKNDLLITTSNDNRITKLGVFLRKYKLDEIPQLLDVIRGNMSFVGTRPEVSKYVNKYKPEYYATLLLPAGITSEASIRYKDENKLIESATDVDKTYLEEILPEKMRYNLRSIKNFNVFQELLTMIRTVLVMFGIEYK